MELQAVRRLIKIKDKDGNTREIPALLPAYENMITAFNKIPKDKMVEVKTKTVRSLNLHRQLWAIVNYTYDNLPEYLDFGSVDAFMDFLKLDVGWYDTYKFQGSYRMFAKSIAFTSCEEADFRLKVYAPIIDKCAIILDMDRDKLIEASIKNFGVANKRRIKIKGKRIQESRLD